MTKQQQSRYKLWFMFCVVLLAVGFFETAVAGAGSCAQPINSNKKVS